MPERIDNRDRVRAVRVPESLWRAAQAVAASRDEHLSVVIRDALKRYVARHSPPS